MNGPLSLRQWRGVVSLVQSGVVETSRAVERVHLLTARRTFDVVERVPVVAAPTAVVRTVHDATLGFVHAVIRVTASAAGGTLAAALDVLEAADLGTGDVEVLGGAEISSDRFESGDTSESSTTSP